MKVYWSAGFPCHLVLKTHCYYRVIVCIVTCIDNCHQEKKNSLRNVMDINTEFCFWIKYVVELSQKHPRLKPNSDLFWRVVINVMPAGFEMCTYMFYVFMCCNMLEKKKVFFFYIGEGGDMSPNSKPIRTSTDFYDNILIHHTVS